MTANLSPEQLKNIEQEKVHMNVDRATELIEYLNKNQVDPIASGQNYGQTEIKDKLKKEV